MLETSKIDDKLKGCFVGLAVGDALGTTLEFLPRNDTNDHTEMTGGGPFNLSAGEWTDDTSMALCLAESLLANPDFAPKDLMNRFSNWWQYGYNSHNGICFDIGNTTRIALSKYLATGDPYAGSADPKSAGNGSLMRFAPVFLSFHSDLPKLIEVAKLQSRTTHAAKDCEDYCEIFAKLLHDILYKSSLPTTDLTRKNVSSSGYVVHTYEAAIWAVATTDNFKQALINAVNLGDDADTVGAVTGQLAGTIYGYSEIPKEWLEKLVWRDKIEELAEQLIDLK